METQSQMRSLLESIDVEMCRLVFRFNTVRCRNLFDAEVDPINRRRLHYLLNAALDSEAHFVKEHRRACQLDARVESSQKLMALLSQADSQREAPRHSQRSNVINFDAAKKRHLDHTRKCPGNECTHISRQWAFMSNAEQARRIAVLSRQISRRLSLVKQAAEFARSQKPSA